MSLDYSALGNAPRLLLEASLQPLQGERFQPTGFPDLGAARYTLSDGTEMLLVESAQSVANRMELACWDEGADDLIPELKGLPYIQVKDANKKIFTNSVLEAHRINSEYIMKTGGKLASFAQSFISEIGYAPDSPVQWKKFYASLFRYDPGCLIHGAFLEEIGGRLRVTRALTGFIEASRIRPVESGGVKNNIVQPELKGGEGNVPFPRTEFVAEKIAAYFNLDLALLRGYALGQDATDLLISLALFKIRRFLSTGLRLRTACDFRLKDDLAVNQPEGFVVPSENDLLQECGRLITKCGSQFAGITQVTWKPDTKSKKTEEPA